MPHHVCACTTKKKIYTHKGLVAIVLTLHSFYLLRPLVTLTLCFIDVFFKQFSTLKKKSEVAVVIEG